MFYASLEDMLLAHRVHLIENLKNEKCSDEQILISLQMYDWLSSKYLTSNEAYQITKKEINKQLGKGKYEEFEKASCTGENFKKLSKIEFDYSQKAEKQNENYDIVDEEE